MVEEFKIYEAMSGNFERMRDRFLAEAAPRLAAHGVSVVAAWEELSDTPKLVYLTRANSEAELKSGWAAFGADPGWKSVKASSEANGPLLANQSTMRVKALDIPTGLKAAGE